MSIRLDARPRQGKADHRQWAQSRACIRKTSRGLSGGTARRSASGARRRPAECSLKYAFAGCKVLAPEVRALGAGDRLLDAREPRGFQRRENVVRVITD